MWPLTLRRLLRSACLLGNRASGDGGALLVYRCEPTQCETEANTYRGNKARVGFFLPGLVGLTLPW
jgi:hypothetical protein